MVFNMHFEFGGCRRKSYFSFKNCTDRKNRNRKLNLKEIKLTPEEVVRQLFIDNHAI